MLQRTRLAAALIVAMPIPADAGSAAVRIDAAVPDVLRERVAAMLRTLRPRDAAVALDASRILDGAWQSGAPLVLRVEADCRDSA